MTCVITERPPGAASRDQLSEYCAVKQLSGSGPDLLEHSRDLMRPLPSTSLAAAEPSASEGRNIHVPVSSTWCNRPPFKRPLAGMEPQSEPIFRYSLNNCI